MSKVLHLLGITHTITTRDAPMNCCAFTQKEVKFIPMMENLGYEIKLYSNESSDIPCSELVPVTTQKDYDETYKDHDFMKQQFEFGSGRLHDAFHKNTPIELAKRVNPGDIVLCAWGTGHIEVLNNLIELIGQEKYSKLLIVEPFIGYPVTFAPFRVYESYARLNVDVGLLDRAGHFREMGVEHHFETRHYTQPRHEDIVIPPYFEPSEFDPKFDKDDYFLFIGRLNESKGIKEAIMLSEVLNKRLIMAGQGTIEDIEKVIGGQLPPTVEFVGAVDIETRKTLYANAEFVIMFTYYPEPGGNVFFESIASATPVITSNRGIFPEVNYQGLTGYRAKSFRDIVTAAENIHKIDNEFCYNYAMDNFSCDRVGLQFDAYFEHIQHLSEEGYWSHEKGRDVSTLDWLVRPYTAEQITEHTERVVKRMSKQKSVIQKVENSSIKSILKGADENTKREILRELGGV